MARALDNATIKQADLLEIAMEVEVERLVNESLHLEAGLSLLTSHSHLWLIDDGGSLLLTVHACVAV